MSGILPNGHGNFFLFSEEQGMFAAMVSEPYVLFHHIGSIPLCLGVRRAFKAAWTAPSGAALYLTTGVQSDVLNAKDCRGWVGFLCRGEDWGLPGKLPCPTINYSNRRGPAHGAVNVFPDEAEIGRIAATHLLERGHTRFTFLGIPGHNYSEERRAAFAEALAAEGQRTEVIAFPERSRAPPSSVNAERMETVGHWLSGTASPCAVFCANDDLAENFRRHVAAISPLRLSSVALVGVDNRAGATRAETSVDLTTIEPNYAGIGAVLARLLADSAKGWPPKETTIVRVGGARLIEGASTATEASTDPLVQRISALIRREVARGEAPDMEQIARELGTSSRSLLSHFRKDTGQTLRDFALAERLRRAARLLLETDNKVADIAFACGFSKHAALSTRFLRHYGCSPREYRQREATRRSPST